MADRVWTKEEIKDLLMRNDKAVCRGLVTLYSLQTRDERETDSTQYHNGVGFGGADAKFLSSLAKQVKSRGFLTPKQMVQARKSIMKYAGQLAKVANGEIVVKVEAKVEAKIEAKVEAKVEAPVQFKAFLYTVMDRADGYRSVKETGIIKAAGIDVASDKFKEMFPDDYYGGNVYQVDESGEFLSGGDFHFFAVKEYYQQAI